VNYLRFLLFPLAGLFGFFAWVRNVFFDRGINKSFQFDFPIILVGNISTGGTGKTPHIEYLIRLLKNKFKVATLSRGYLRKTQGFIISTEKSLVEDIGDEPKQYKQKFPDIEVAVGEQRILAIPDLLTDEPQTEVILMDDGFQHRSLRPGFSILLTSFGNLFTDDYLLPVGNLREPRSGYKRADIIVVTQCPNDMTSKKSASIIKKLKPVSGQPVFFSTYSYQNPVSILDKEVLLKTTSKTDVLLLSGVANEKGLKAFVKENFKSVKSMKFRDHHFYNERDLEYVKMKFEGIQSANKVILTTEKDAMRLMEKREWIENNKLPFFYQPIKVEFLFEGADKFDECIFNYVDGQHVVTDNQLVS
jgi:tetraacyldisaccharide 4'-kinase